MFRTYVKCYNTQKSNLLFDDIYGQVFLIEGGDKSLPLYKLLLSKQLFRAGNDSLMGLNLLTLPPQDASKTTYFTNVQKMNISS